MKENANYTVLNDANFQREVLESPKPVLVEFGAQWCGTCHIIAPIIEDLASAFEEQIKVCKMDVDAHERVSHGYGIQDLPTLLFFKNGQVVDHIVGAVPKNVIAAKIDGLLKTEQKGKDHGN